MKRYIIPLFVGLIFIGFGSCYLWFEITDFTFINKVPEQALKEKQDTYEFPMVEGGNYRVVGNDSIVEITTSDEIVDKMIVNVYYYPEFTSVDYHQNSYYENKPVKNIIFYREEGNEWNTIKNMKKFILNDIKEKTLHNYNLLVQPSIVVTVPTDWKDNVTIISDEDRMVDYFDEDK